MSDCGVGVCCVLFVDDISPCYKDFWELCFELILVFKVREDGQCTPILLLHLHSFVFFCSLSYFTYTHPNCWKYLWYSFPTISLNCSWSCCDCSSTSTAQTFIPSL